MDDPGPAESHNTDDVQGIAHNYGILGKVKRIKHDISGDAHQDPVGDHYKVKNLLSAVEST